MTDSLISRLANARAIAAERLPAVDAEAIDDAIAALAALRADEKRAVPEGWQQVAHLFRGVRVEGDTVIISVKGGNEAARLLCGELILLMLAAAPLPKEQT